MIKLLNDLPCWLQGVFLFAIVFAIYAKYYREKIFGKLLCNFVRKLNPFFAAGKRALFEEAFKKIKKQNSLKVLEIGVGTGANFQFYPENCQITISDKSDHFMSYLKDSLKSIQREDLQISDFVLADAQNMKNIQSGSYDAVVATFTLCSMENLSAVFTEIHRVLKPNGVFLFMDHSKNTKRPLIAFIQTIIEPVWSFILDGCRFKDIRSEIERHSKFEKLEIKEHTKCTGLFHSLLNPVFYGYAQKSLSEN